MLLFSISMGIIVSVLGALLPDLWLILKIAGAVSIVLVGRKIL
jgi:hypothetical protein